MAIQLKSTKQSAADNGVKMMVFGQSGSGKTTLAATFGVPTIIISAEAGLLSLRKFDIPVIEVKSVADVFEAYNYLLTEEGQQFKAIVIDSVSEIGEVLLSEEREKTRDGRAAYGETNNQMMQMLRAFRDLPGRHVLFIAKLDKVKDDMTGAVLYGPSMPGSKLGQAIPYLTDEVFALRVERDGEGNPVRVLQTQPDLQWQAKDRSGSLPQYCQPNMAEIIDLITAD